MRNAGPGPIPSDPIALTHYLQRNCKTLRKFKRKGIPEEMEDWLDQLGAAICKHGLQTGRLSAAQIGASVFIVNRLHHRQVAEATAWKDRLVEALLKRHRESCRMTMITDRNSPYRGTCLVEISCWQTHVPAHFFRETPARECPRKRRHPTFGYPAARFA